MMGRNKYRPPSDRKDGRWTVGQRFVSHRDRQRDRVKTDGQDTDRQRKRFKTAGHGTKTDRQRKEIQVEPVTHEATGSRSAEVVCDGQQGFRECKEIQDDGGGHHADFNSLGSCSKISLPTVDVEILFL